jgi:hypothetical protein
MGGLLYGSTWGTFGNPTGTLFQIDPNTGAEKTLRRNLPAPSGLIVRHGVLYGTTYNGGKLKEGSLFSLTP